MADRTNPLYPRLRKYGLAVMISAAIALLARCSDDTDTTQPDSAAGVPSPMTSTSAVPAAPGPSDVAPPPPAAQQDAPTSSTAPPTQDASSTKPPAPLAVTINDNATIPPKLLLELKPEPKDTASSAMPHGPIAVAPKLAAKVTTERDPAAQPALEPKPDKPRATSATAQAGDGRVVLDEPNGIPVFEGETADKKVSWSHLQAVLRQAGWQVRRATDGGVDLTPLQ